MPSIVIPAHNEEALLARTLDSLLATATTDEFEIVVVCNGCTDRTVEIASTYEPRLRTVTIDEASKIAALNVGDASCTSFPRIYLDADVVLTTESVRSLLHALEDEEALAAEPRPTMDLTNATIGVRAWYRVWLDLYGAIPGKLGSGVLGLSERGRARFDRFPDITADDSYVRAWFDLHELVHVTGASSIVTGPGTLGDLIKIKTRSRRGSRELATLFPDLWRAQMQRRPAATSLTALSPKLWPLAPWYVLITFICSVRAKRQIAAGFSGWERDESGRERIGTNVDAP